MLRRLGVSQNLPSFLDPTGTRFPDRPGPSRSLCRLRYPGSHPFQDQNESSSYTVSVCTSNKAQSDYIRKINCWTLYKNLRAHDDHTENKYTVWAECRVCGVIHGVPNHWALNGDVRFKLRQKFEITSDQYRPKRNSTAFTTDRQYEAHGTLSNSFINKSRRADTDFPLRVYFMETETVKLYCECTKHKPV